MSSAVGNPLPEVIIGGEDSNPQAILETDPQAEANFLGPRRQVSAMYNAELDRLHLDGFVYPADPDAAGRRDHAAGRHA